MKEDLSCKKYDPATRQCTIYDSRPDICRIDRMWEKVRAKEGEFKGISQGEFHVIQAHHCHRLQNDLGLGDEWRVKLG